MQVSGIEWHHQNKSGLLLTCNQKQGLHLPHDGTGMHMMLKMGQSHRSQCLQGVTKSLSAFPLSYLLLHWQKRKRPVGFVCLPTIVGAYIFIKPYAEDEPTLMTCRLAFPGIGC